MRWDQRWYATDCDWRDMPAALSSLKQTQTQSRWASPSDEENHLGGSEIAVSYPRWSKEARIAERYERVFE